MRKMTKNPLAVRLINTPVIEDLVHVHTLDAIHRLRLDIIPRQDHTNQNIGPDLAANQNIGPDLAANQNVGPGHVAHIRPRDIALTRADQNPEIAPIEADPDLEIVLLSVALGTGLMTENIEETMIEREGTSISPVIPHILGILRNPAALESRGLDRDQSQERNGNRQNLLTIHRSRNLLKNLRLLKEGLDHRWER